MAPLVNDGKFVNANQISGVLPPAHGGTGSTGSTGTGLLVLQTAPTIATPTFTTAITLGGKANTVIPTSAGSTYHVSGSTSVPVSADTVIGNWVGIVGFGPFDLVYTGIDGRFTNLTTRQLIVTATYSDSLSTSSSGTNTFLITKNGDIANALGIQGEDATNPSYINVSATALLNPNDYILLYAFQTGTGTESTGGGGRVQFNMTQL